jgi:hypothetical protein
VTFSGIGIANLMAGIIRTHVIRIQSSRIVYRLDRSEATDRWQQPYRLLSERELTFDAGFLEPALDAGFLAAEVEGGLADAPREAGFDVPVAAALDAGFAGEDFEAGFALDAGLACNNTDQHSQYNQPATDAPISISSGSTVRIGMHLL